jgi:hypothetical protein
VLEIRLPRLVGSRSSAAHLVEQSGDGIKGERVVINARELLSGSPSFADEMVKGLLVQGGASELVLVGAGTDFAGYVQQSAQARSVSDRVVIKPSGAEIGA